ncbi:MAG: methyltransferase domain-containing protein [Acetobacteraceae bacterium]|nr:methyltransferase domain-containing protein [Acetobacteraceae bacterium]
MDQALASPTAAADWQTDFAAARRFMVDGQVRPNAVTDPLLISALREVPREVFVPAALRSRAYADEMVTVAPGRRMLTPMVLARLLQAALPQPGERALVLGAGTGYGAAILARMGAEVVAVEPDPGLADAGRAACAAALSGPRPDIVTADPSRGFPDGAPFALIVIEGAVQTLPEAVPAQLREAGRLVFLREVQEPLSRAVLARRLGGAVSERVLFEAAAPVLPGFAAPRTFTL